ncbi:CHAT domain-containing protein [Sphingomonas sp. UV9]|uniref:CHAT domain-containing protein n=1 Tax=Sphingomonas sp. UV9 TaxID=1851410 RepID=UPI000FFC9240|nr:CHAT domain-containing protein [Sphingomonas sp. UV9]RXD04884.1 CHAT domain-containing protein [Sphingomonas sp. UV9]
MQSDQYKRDLAQITKDVGKVRSDIGGEEDKARTARTAASQKRASAAKASSASTRDMHVRQADAEDKKVAAAEKRIGALQNKLSILMTRQASKEQSLRTAERSETANDERAATAARNKGKADQDKRDRADDARRRKEKTEQAKRDRDAAKRHQADRDRAREIGRLASGTVHHVHVREPQPEKLRVLYLTASPATPNLTALRVDAEVNNVLRALRGAEHRDLVDFRHRPAATVQDLVDGLNELRPHVVHFSGHAGEGLLFDTADPITPGDELVGYDKVASLLGATDQTPALVVLNACHTMDGVDRILQVAPIVIATNDTVGDSTSHIFAVQFYTAIAAAQTIGNALSQARTMIAQALPDEMDVIVVHAAEGVDPNQVQLVRPHSGG